MTLLIDSQVLVWLLFGTSRLKPKTRELISSADDVCVSMASLWELAIKYYKGRFEHSPEQIMRGLAGSGIQELEIADRHILSLPLIELPHRDPFDRMLVAQAEADGLTLVTADRALLASPYATLDARS